MKIKLKIGDKVIYKPKNEKGIVKFVNNQCAWVVYSCGGDWKNYNNYTGESTVLTDLKLGWEKNV